MSVFSKTPGLSNISGPKRPRLGPPMLGSSSGRDVFRFGSSCESPGPLNMPSSDSLTATASTFPRSVLASAVEKLERERLRAT